MYGQPNQREYDDDGIARAVWMMLALDRVHLQFCICISMHAYECWLVVAVYYWS
jgi:hypothetical protein